MGNEAETSIEIKIKTLDSQTYTVRVDKQMPIPALKEEIASVTGVLSDQQRLICRGKVLKDDQLLSAYNVEDGHALHLVVRQPQSSLSGDHSSSDGSNDGSATMAAPEFTHIVSFVFSSFEIPISGEGIDVRANGLQRHERTSDPNNGFGFPDSLTALSQHLSRVRREFDGIGSGEIANSASNSQNSVTSLAQVMMSTRQMLNEQVGENLLQLARQLENQENATGSLQASALRTGALLQNLGAYILELGRTAMNLGNAGGVQSDSSSVNSLFLGRFQDLASGPQESGRPNLETNVEEANLQEQATDPVGLEPRASDEGMFLSNLLHQIMPLISQNAGAEPNEAPLEESSDSEHGMDENSGAGSSRRQRDSQLNPPSPKRQKRE